MCADHTKPKKTELQVVKPAPTVPTTAGANPWLDVAGERIGKILKFNKGIWLIQTEEIVPGTRYIAGIDQLSREWIHFQDDGHLSGEQRVQAQEWLAEQDASFKDATIEAKRRETRQFILGIIVGALGALGTIIAAWLVMRLI